MFLFLVVFVAGFYTGVTLMCLLFMAKKGDEDGENALEDRDPIVKRMDIKWKNFMAKKGD